MSHFKEALEVHDGQEYSPSEEIREDLMDTKVFKAKEYKFFEKNLLMSALTGDPFVVRNFHFNSQKGGPGWLTCRYAASSEVKRIGSGQNEGRQVHQSNRGFVLYF